MGQEMIVSQKPAATERETWVWRGEMQVRHEARCGSVCSKEIGFAGAGTRMEGMSKSPGDTRI